MKPMHTRYARLLLALALGAAPASALAQADPIADFYKGKTVTIVASGGVGGPIDLACRVVAKFLSRHIPGNPTIVVRNMPGGGHVLMSNLHVHAGAPRTAPISAAWSTASRPIR